MATVAGHASANFHIHTVFGKGRQITGTIATTAKSPLVVVVVGTLQSGGLSCYWSGLGDKHLRD